MEPDIFKNLKPINVFSDDFAEQMVDVRVGLHLLLTHSCNETEKLAVLNALNDIMVSMTNLIPEDQTKRIVIKKEKDSFRLNN